MGVEGGTWECGEGIWGGHGRVGGMWACDGGDVGPRGGGTWACVGTWACGSWRSDLGNLHS